MAQIYRKALLDRLSSPEQLDRMIVITSPSFWIAVLGAGLIVTVALIWSILGKLPVKVQARGIYMNSDGVGLIYSDISGRVDSVEVSPGDLVKEGDILLRISGGDLQGEIDTLEKRIASVEAVTLESENDQITVDNKDLLSIKTQIDDAALQVDQDRTTLADRREEYNAVKAEVDDLYVDVLELRKDYYGTLGRAPSSKRQLEYEDARSDYDKRGSAYENAADGYSKAMSDYQSLLNEMLTSAVQYYESLIGGGQNTGASEEGKEPAELSDPPSQEPQSPDYGEYLQALNAISADTAPEAFPKAAVEALNGWNEDAMPQLYEAWAQVASAKTGMDNAKDHLDDAYDDMQDARDDYYQYTDRQNRLQARQQDLSVRYSDLYSEYSTRYSLMVNLEQTVHALETQAITNSMAVQVQIASYTDQFTTLKAATIDSLRKELEKYQRNLDNTRIAAVRDGVVSEVLVSPGAVITQGSEIAQIRSGKDKGVMVTCYIPVTDGKKVSEGMKVMVYPSTVNRQEYGHMEATVISVDSYVTNASKIKNFLGDDSLVNAFAGNGPVIAVTCQLRQDPETASGYYWSSRKGAGLTVPEGTMISADIVTEYKTPISMVIPLLKDKLSIRAGEPEQNSGGAP